MTNFYRAGWRPLGGWVCISGIAVSQIVIPLVNVMLTACHLPTSAPGGTADLASLIGALGLAATRSYDKTKGNE